MHYLLNDKVWTQTDIGIEAVIFFQEWIAIVFIIGIMKSVDNVVEYTSVNSSTTINAHNNNLKLRAIAS